MRKFLALLHENSLLFLLNKAMVYVLPHSKLNSGKECIWVRMRGFVLAKKGNAKAEFPS